jgi:hypothetical protein
MEPADIGTHPDIELRVLFSLENRGDIRRL